MSALGLVAVGLSTDKKYAAGKMTNNCPAEASD
jgi:hypothetical protein